MSSFGLSEHDTNNAKEANAPLHCYWDSWVLLALTASVVFTLRESMIGGISLLAYEGLCYIGTGPLVFCIIYFIYKKEW